MPHPIDALLDKAQRAIELQSWQEAHGLLQRIDPTELGAREADYLLLAATCLRHQGELGKAQEMYQQLRGQLSLQDERMADALIGEAECVHALCEYEEAERLAYAASQVPNTGVKLQLRVSTVHAHIVSHLDIHRAVEMFRQGVERFGDMSSSAVANLVFNYADALLVAGEYEASLKELLRAQELGKETGAIITVADAMRRIPLVRVLMGQVEFALRGVGDLQLAENLYDLAGDRGKFYLQTESGEVHRALGRYREAKDCFTRGRWGARELDDPNRIAHNALGLFEISRAASTPRWDYLEEAREHYQKIRSDWGLLHCLIAQALADPKQRGELLKQAHDLIEASGFSRFERERELLNKLRNLDGQSISREPHLMNYP